MRLEAVGALFWGSAIFEIVAGLAATLAARVAHHSLIMIDFLAND